MTIQIQNKTIMRKFFIISILFLSASLANCQTVDWLIKPAYTEITHYSKDIFKCLDEKGKLHLVDWNGRELLEGLDANEVTDYSNGYAVVLSGDRIVAFLSEDNHKVTKVEGTYYRTRYSFFSEGYIAVAQDNVNGKQGYLDTQGNLVFKCIYLEARPFKMGWASVYKDGGSRSRFCAYLSQDSSIGEVGGIVGLGGNGDNIYYASSFNDNGQALVYGKNKKYQVINTRLTPTKEIRVEKFSAALNKYDYSYKSDSTDEKDKPDNEKPTEADRFAEIVSDGSTYGYRNEKGKTFVPVQFSEVQRFYDRRAIVTKNGKVGVVKYLDGDFSVNWPDENIRVYPNGKTNQIPFSIEIPSSLQPGKAVLRFDNGEGTFSAKDSFGFDFFPSIKNKRNDCRLRGKVEYDGLLLWEEEKIVAIDVITVDVTNPVTTSPYADENNRQTVRTVVTNTSKVDVRIDATLKVAGHSVPFRGNLGPNQSKVLLVTVEVNENTSVQASVSVKADGYDCVSKSATVNLKKI